jgi:uncharacterized protein (TIGR02302 family)
MPDSAPLRFYRWKLRLARLAVAWEYLWPALWPAGAAFLVFLVLAAFDVLPTLPALARAAILAGLLALGLGPTLGRLARISWPGPAAGRRRLERDNDLAHRPLDVIADSLAGAPDPASLALWSAHRARMAGRIAGLRVRPPRAGLARTDAFALRGALLLLLFVGVLGAGDDLPSRLARAIATPDGSGGMPALVGVDLWLTPPAYTGAAPIHLAGSPEKPVAVPVGSSVLVQVHGGSTVPRLLVDGRATPLETMAAGNYALRAPLGEATRLQVAEAGRSLAVLALIQIPDQPPTAEWTAPPSVTPRAALRLDYLAKDDYGVQALEIEVRRPGSAEPAIILPVLVPDPARPEVKGSAFEDLTASDWAGLPVELRLIAHDAIGQSGTGQPLRVTLPERHFHHPVARALIDQRKLLKDDPSQADAVFETLGDLARRPDRFNGDLAVFLALRSAASRLALDHDPDSIPGVRRELWDTALRIEDGATPASEQSLREAEQALMAALDRNASDAEIDRLTQNLHRAIDRYLQAMVQNAMRDGKPVEGQGPNGPTISPQDIQRMLDAARDMAKTGSRDAARQALAQLQTMLEGLHAGRAGGQGPAQALDREMRDLAHRQQQLQDKAFKDAQRPDTGSNPGLADAQSALRHRLDALRGGRGGKPGRGAEGPAGGESLERAGRAMDQAEDALRRGSPGDAVEAQGEALQALQQASRELQAQMGEDGEAVPADVAGGRDPFGRTPGGAGAVDRGDVQLPGAADLQKSREILDELRRRAGERERPAPERDYIDRLLKRF